MNQVKFKFLAIFLTALVASCGGGGGGGGSTSTPLIGYVIDAPVEGLSYSCGGLSGTTGSDGSFLHDSGSACTFKIGNVTIGNFNAAPSDGIVTPHDLAGVSRSDPLNSSAVAIAQFLQSLDDGSGSGKIKIPVPVVTALSAVPAQKIVDTTPLSQNQLSALVSTATNNTKTLVSAATAAAAMNTYIQTTYPNLDTNKGAVAPTAPSGNATAAAPTLTSALPTTLTATGTSTGFTATSDINATGYYVVLPAANAAPSKWQIISGTDASSKPVSLSGSVAMTGGTAINNTLSGLAFNTAYKVYFVAVNALQTSKVSDIASSSVTTLPEPKAPALTETFSDAINQTNHAASFSVTSDVTSVGYWVVLPSTAARPTSAQIINGKDASGNAFALSGNAAMAAGTAKSFSFSGMEYQTAYKLYFVAVNTADTTKVTSVYSSNVSAELAYELTVVPLKGAIYGATVTAYESNGSTVLASSLTGAKTSPAAGKATLLIPAVKASSPIIILVKGNAAATYYDEKSTFDGVFPATAQLVTVLGSLQSNSSTGVTPLTTMSAKLSGVDIATLGSPSAAPAGLKSDTVLEGAVRLLLALGLPTDFNIFSTPTVLTSISQVSSSDANTGLIANLGANTTALSSLDLFSNIIASTPKGSVSSNGQISVTFSASQIQAFTSFKTDVDRSAVMLGVSTSASNFAPTSNSLASAKTALSSPIQSGTTPVASPAQAASGSGAGNGNGSGSGSGTGSSAGY